jgi:predicted nucleotidyltransferase
MENQTLTPDYREFFEALHAHRVEYLLVGGYAVGLHGFVRNTDDIDFWVGHDSENAQRVLAAVTDFAGTAGNLTIDHFNKPESIVFIGVEPYRLDILTSIAGVEFHDCFAKADVMELDGMQVNVIDLNSLIVNKTVTGRDADKIDVDRLQE